MIVEDKSPPPLGAKDIDGVFVAWTFAKSHENKHLFTWDSEPSNNTRHMTFWLLHRMATTWPAMS